MAIKFEYVFFDVAGTLLHKPVLFTTIQKTLAEYGFEIAIDTIREKHKIVSELIHFPDRTNKEFYASFNSSFLLALGILPRQEILEELFARCSYLPWEKFEDTDMLSELDIPLGIISNFNTTLKEKLAAFFPFNFDRVLVSEELGSAKPSLAFYEKAIDNIGIEPGKILYVGDSLKLDIIPALEVGMVPFLIDREHYYMQCRQRIGTLNDLKPIIYG